MSLSPTDPFINATVFASAGTGKTWLLVARLARLLLAGAKPGSILAVTFTKKAAGEMQERLLERLQHWAICDEEALRASLAEVGADTDIATQQRARCLYEEMLNARYPIRLTTFHSFCNELLSQFPLEAGIPPGYELIENTQELQEEAWELLMQETRQDRNPQLYATMADLLHATGGMGSLKSALDAFLAQRSDWWAYTEDQSAPLNWALERLPEMFQCSPDDDPYEGICGPQWLARFRRYAKLLQADKANATMKKNGAAIEAALDEGSNDAILKALITAAKTAKGDPRALKTSKAYVKANGEEDADELLRLHAEINGRLDDFIDHNNRLNSLKFNAAWYHAGSRYLQHYQALKLQQRQLDFADMEWEAYKLLNRSDDASWVQYKLDQRIDHLLIDEFQDTNPTQWQLLKPLLEEFASGEQERWRSVFLVGDTKQSIYSFRRANPRLQDTAAQWLRTHLDSQPSSMDKSRRSSIAIMQAVNAVFQAEPFKQQVSQFQPHDTHLDGLWGRVEIHPAFEQEKEDDKSIDPGLRNPITTPRQEKISVKTLEADFIARRIEALIDEQIPIGPAGEARPIRYGDITILLRARTGAGHIENALRSRSIPYQGTARGGLLPRLEITDIRALLRLLHTPQDNLALAQVLKSPLFSFDDEDLIRLAEALKFGINGQEHKPEHWFAALQGIAEHTDAPEHFQHAHRLLQGWRKDYSSLPLHDLLEKIYFEGNVINRYSAASFQWQRTQVITNLQRLVELALELDSGRYPSLNHFLSRLEELENSGSAPSEPKPDHKDDPVRILTIHESKGLEAPVIFYADLAAKPQNDKAWGSIIEWPPESPSPEAVLLQPRSDQLDSISRSFMERRKQRQHEEDGNLIYVALTRARQMLILSASRARGASKLFDDLYEALAPLCHKEDNADFPDMLAFEAGERPSLSKQATAEETTQQIPPPPEQLSRPFRLEPTYVEILPSQLDDNTGLDKIKAPHTPQRETPAISQEDALLRGNAIHAYLEGLSQPDRAAHTSEEQRLQSLTYRIAAQLNLEPDDPRLPQWQAEALSVIQQHPDLFQLSAEQQGYNEQPILYRHEGQQVYGIIDRLIISDHSILVIDYKTHSITQPQEAHAIAPEYNAQLRAYATGIAKIWPGRSVRTELLFTAINQRVEIKV